MKTPLRSAVPAQRQMTPPSVIVIGEALVDIMIRLDGTTVATPGGSPMNVAVTLARLGLPTHLATSLADDEHGKIIKTHEAVLVRAGRGRLGGASARGATSGAMPARPAQRRRC